MNPFTREQEPKLSNWMIQQQNQLHSWGLIPLDAHCLHWSFACQVFVGSINRGYDQDAKDHVGNDGSHTDLARGLPPFALCQQGLWLDLCHAALPLIPRAKRGT